MKKIFLTSALSLVMFTVIGSGIIYAQPPTQGGNPPTQGGNPPTQGGNPPGDITLENPLRGGVNSLFGLLRLIIDKILLPIGGILAVLAFIYSGFLYVTAQGNEAKIKTAHTALLYTAIGTALLLGAWVFAGAICGTIAAIADNPNLCPK